MRGLSAGVAGPDALADAGTGAAVTAVTAEAALFSIAALLSFCE